jgi:hypothetical protein
MLQRNVLGLELEDGKVVGVRTDEGVFSFDFRLPRQKQLLEILLILQTRSKRSALWSESFAL